jgi:antitoxin ParD1/3/4
MNVSLTAELEDMVNEKVRSGLYASASEVVREGLRLLVDNEELRRTQLVHLQRDVNLGIEQMERGESSVYESPEALANDIKQEGRRRMNRATRVDE